MALEWNPVQATLLQRLDTVSSVDSGQVDITHGISRNVSLTSGLTGGGPQSTAAYSVHSVHTLAVSPPAARHRGHRGEAGLPLLLLLLAVAPRAGTCSGQLARWCSGQSGAGVDPV